MEQPIKVRKKPMVVECLQWTGANIEAMVHFVGAQNLNVESTVDSPLVYQLWVAKSEEWISLRPGMWAVREPDGLGFYPVAGEVFDALYEAVDL